MPTFDKHVPGEVISQFNASTMRLLALVTQPPAYAAPSRTIAKHQDFRAGMQSAL